MSDKTTDENREPTEASDSVDMLIEDTGAGMVEIPEQAENDTPVQPARRRSLPWFGLLNFLLILGLIAAAGYYWQLQQKTEVEKQAAFNALKNQIASKAESSQVESGLRPLESGLATITQRIATQQQQQQDLQDSTEQLYKLFGRDQNGWQLAEVEYLMRIAQHKLILENDFEGAALTLQAASDRIASTGDPGLLPVRVKISDEIAELKTRSRADLVGMTLKLAQLARQIRSLKPGFQPDIVEPAKAEPESDAAAEADFVDWVRAFLGSQVKIEPDTELPPIQTETLIINVNETLEDNLKLTRWSVLERDVVQYRRLMKQNIELFRQYYNLDDAANHDFLSQLEALQKAEIKPEKPDILGSLEMLRKIISKRDDAADQPIGEDRDNV
ncbi:MAG: hypothetical protein GY820_05030 [Gammaproteobacteria bacterium]|nr:hypothetical protein [Gammaproteobacteria bacterium]